VDIEVLLVNLMGLSRLHHRYSHTFLIGTAIGAVWGLVAYAGLPIFRWLMKKIKMIVSGIL
jgi:hypothetical protein